MTSSHLRLFIACHLLLALGAPLTLSSCGSSEPDEPWVTARDGETPPDKPDYPDGVIVPSQPVGYLDGDASVSASGAAQYVIPLSVPPGRAGIQPDIALAYSSGGGNGMAGVGWGLTGLSEIRRCPRTIASDGKADGVDWTSADAWCLDGARLVRISFDASDGSLVFRSENDAFMRVKGYTGSDPNAVPVSFRTWSKSGQVMSYRPVHATRSDVDAATGAVTQTSAITAYVLDKVSDRSGNTMRIEYDISTEPGTNAVEYLPTRISYTLGEFEAPANARRFVQFVYQDRLGFDRAFQFHFGVRERQTRRLASIEMHAPAKPGGSPELAWRYFLDYTTSDSTFRALLSKVRLCDAKDVCMWDKELTWNSEQDEGDLSEIPVASTLVDGQVQTPIGLVTSCWRNPPDVAPLVLDADGDGKDDLLTWDRWECIEDPQPPPESGIWGTLKWRLVLRLSKNGPLSQEIEVGEATRTITIATPQNDDSLPYQYSGPRLSSSRPIDIDGDGQQEIYMSRVTSGVREFALLDWNSTTQSFVGLTGWLNAERVDFTDFNGDGLVDMALSVANKWYVRLNLGPPSLTFGPTTDTGLEDTVEDGPGSYDSDPSTFHQCSIAPRAGDFDANGRGDLLVPGWPCLPLKMISLDDNGALAITSNQAFNVLTAHLVDANGDGLRDSITSDQGQPAVRWNSGRGYLPVQTASGLPDMTKTAFPLDVNGDGREDLLTIKKDAADPAYHDERLYVSMVNGAGAAQFFDFLLADNVLNFSTSTTPGELEAAMQFGDFDGDGTAEIAELVRIDGVPGAHARELYLRELALSTDLDVVTEVRDEGASHPGDAFLYSRAWSDDPDPQTCSYPQQCLKHGITVVREHRASQGEALWPSALRTLYEYERPRKDLRGRGFLGFGEIRTLEVGLYSQVTTVYDNVTRVPEAGREIYPFAGMPQTVTEIVPILEQPATVPGAPPASAKARVRVRVNTNTVAYPTAESYTSMVQRWTSSESEANVAIAPDKVTVSGTPVPKRSTKGSYSYDTWNNLLSNTVETVGGVTSSKTVTYINDSTSWLLGLPDRVSERSYDPDDPIPSWRVNDYDYDSLGRLVAVTGEPDYPGTQYWQKTVLDLTAQGLVWRSTTSVATGEASRVSLFEYDDEGIFVEQQRNPAGHWTTELHHPAFGEIAIAVDPNGHTSTGQYDGFGRPTLALPWGGVAVSSAYSAYQPTPGINAGLVLTTTGSDGQEAVATHDEHGRVIEQRHRGFDGSWIHSTVRYNLFGSATRVSRPGFAAPASAAETYTWDSLGHLVRAEGPDGATTTVAHDWFESTMTDPDKRVHKTLRDIDERIVETDVWPTVGGPNQVRTQFAYGPFDLVNKITDHKGNLVQSGYDKLGRQLWLSDPDTGFTSYVYNGYDEVKTETEALGVPRHFAYDALGRVTSLNDADGSTFFQWDMAPDGIGSLSRTESPDGVVVELGYDKFGFHASSLFTVGAYSATPEKFLVENTHDDQGRIDEVLYPEVPGRTRFKIKAVYNVRGHLDRWVESSNPAQPTLWQVAGRAADGQLTQSYTSNGALRSDFSYHPLTGRPQSFSSLPTGGKPIHSLSYDYYPGGDLKTRTDSIAKRSEGFEYDGADRLTRWTLESTTGAFNKRDTRYNYDELGNLAGVLVDGFLTEKHIIGWNGKPHALASTNGATFAYDAMGRQTSGPARAITYNALSLPDVVTDKATGKKAQYEYDAAGMRVRKVVGSTKTIYIADLYERREDGGAFTHVFMVPGENGPTMQVSYQQATKAETRYLLVSDPLSSVELVLDGALKEVSRRYVEPFGRRTGVDGKPITPKVEDVTAGFTGHEEEADLGLINMRGRIYDPVQRRFLTPDPLVPDPLFGQAYNRYSYVLNNPLRYTDPTGFDPKEGEESPWKTTIPKVKTQTVITVTFEPPEPEQPECTDDTGDTPDNPDEREEEEPPPEEQGAGGAPRGVTDRYHSKAAAEGAMGGPRNPNERVGLSREDEERMGPAARQLALDVAEALVEIPPVIINLDPTADATASIGPGLGRVVKKAVTGTKVPRVARQSISRTIVRATGVASRVAYYLTNPAHRKRVEAALKVVAKAKEAMDRDALGQIFLKLGKNAWDKARNPKTPWFFPIYYGKALEKLSARGLKKLGFRHIGGSSPFDFVFEVDGKAIMKLEITTVEGWATHVGRPDLQTNTGIILYMR